MSGDLVLYRHSQRRTPRLLQSSRAIVKKQCSPACPVVERLCAIVHTTPHPYLHRQPPSPRFSGIRNK